MIRSGDNGRVPGAPGPAGAWPSRLRSVCLVVLTVVVAAAGLRLGRALLVPFVAALLLSAMLLPVVRLLRRRGIPAPLAAAALLLGLLVLLGSASVRLAQPALAWMDELPTVLREAKPKLTELLQPMEQVAAAAESIEDVADEGSGDDGGAIEVVSREEGLSDLLLANASTVVSGTVVAAFLLFFLLADGVGFLGHLVRALPTYRDRRLVRRIARSVELQIARYLATITAINAVLGLTVGVLLYLLDVPNPVLWGLLAALFNYVPYVGAVVGVTLVAAVSLITFDSTTRILLPPLSYALVNSLEGMLFTPLIIGRRWLVRPTVVFAWLVLWSWLWGVAGALLAIPMLVAFRIVCEHLPVLSPVAAFLARERDGVLRDPEELPVEEGA